LKGKLEAGKYVSRNTIKLIEQYAYFLKLVVLLKAIEQLRGQLRLRVTNDELLYEIVW
jgi:hypothetical protein